MRRVPHGVAAFLLTLAYALASAQDAPPAAPAAPPRPVSIARIVNGIISFTQWPNGNQKLRLCLTTPSPDTEILVNEWSMSNPQASVTYLTPQDAHFDTDCDVAFIENVDEADHEHLFQRLANRPILSIADAMRGCLMGSLFCLSDPGTPVSFAANLDTIGRSGLHINPKVLLLARVAHTK